MFRSFCHRNPSAIILRTDKEPVSEMPRRRQKRRQQEEARPNSLSPRPVIRVRNAAALDTRNRSIREAIAELEREKSGENVEDFPSDETCHPKDPKGTSSGVPSVMRIYPSRKALQGKRLDELVPFLSSDQSGTRLHEAVLSMEFLLDRIDEATPEYAVAEATNVVDEFERVSALQVGFRK